MRNTKNGRATYKYLHLKCRAILNISVLIEYCLILQTVNFPFIGSIIPASPADAVCIQPIHVIPGLVPSTANFSTAFRCLRKSYAHKAILLLSWSNRHKTFIKRSTVVIVNWLTVMKYRYLKWQWIFSL